MVVLNAALLLQACKAFILQMVVGLFSHCNLKYFDILDILATGLLILYYLQYLLQIVIKLSFLLEMIHWEMWVDINDSLMNAVKDKNMSKATV